jgi:hypothetical protein
MYMGSKVHFHIIAQFLLHHIIYLLLRPHNMFSLLESCMLVLHIHTYILFLRSLAPLNSLQIFPLASLFYSFLIILQNIKIFFKYVNTHQVCILWLLTGRPNSWFILSLFLPCYGTEIKLVSLFFIPQWVT